MSITERDHAVYKMALTLAHNLCVQRSDRHNADDETSEAKTAHQCAVLIGTWLDASDEQIAEMMREYGIGATGGATSPADTIADLEQEARLMRARMERLEGEQRELLETLEQIAKYPATRADEMSAEAMRQLARAAIAKAEGKV